MSVCKTTSELMAYAECPMKHQYGYVMRLAPKRPRERLEEGTILHRVLQEYYDSCKTDRCIALLDELLLQYRAKFERLVTEKERPKIDLEVARLKGVLRGYLHVQAPKDYEQYSSVCNEQEFCFDLDPKRGWKFAGKIDSVFLEKDAGQYLLVDHKYQVNPAGEDARIRYQAFWYCLGLARDPRLRINCHKVGYNLVRHSQHRLKKAEQVADLEERIYQDFLQQPEHYVNRVELKVSEEILKQAERAMRVLYERSLSPPEERYLNPGQQCAWRCSFKEVCFNPDLPQEDFLARYIIRTKAHPELETVSGS